MQPQSTLKVADLELDPVSLPVQTAMGVPLEVDRLILHLEPRYGAQRREPERFDLVPVFHAGVEVVDEEGDADQGEQRERGRLRLLGVRQVVGEVVHAAEVDLPAHRCVPGGASREAHDRVHVRVAHDLEQRLVHGHQPLELVFDLLITLLVPCRLRNNTLKNIPCIVLSIKIYFKMSCPYFLLNFG